MCYWIHPSQNPSRKTPILADQSCWERTLAVWDIRSFSKCGPAVWVAAGLQDHCLDPSLDLLNQCPWAGGHGVDYAQLFPRVSKHCMLRPTSEIDGRMSVVNPSRPVVLSQNCPWDVAGELLPVSGNCLTPFKSELLEMGCGHLYFLQALLVSQVGCSINVRFFFFFDENQRLLVVRKTPDLGYTPHCTLPHFHYKNESHTKKCF